MKKLLKIMVSGAMLVLLAGTLTACGKTEIDVMEGLELNYNGVDGYGTASIADSYVWEDSAMEAAGIDEDKMTDDNIGDMFKGMAAIEEAVSYEVYPNENLSNGDEVTVKATVDNESVEEYVMCIRKDIDKGTFGFPQPVPLEGSLEDILEDEVDEEYYLKDSGMDRLFDELVEQEILPDPESGDPIAAIRDGKWQEKRPGQVTPDLQDLRRREKSQL